MGGKRAQQQKKKRYDMKQKGRHKQDVEDQREEREGEEVDEKMWFRFLEKLIKLLGERGERGPKGKKRNGQSRHGKDKICTGISYRADASGVSRN